MTEQFKHINVTKPRAKRLKYPAPGEAVLEEVAVGAPSKEQVILKTLYSGISKGTESLVFHGKVLKSEWPRMRCPYMVGNFDFPVSYGYACVAEVLEKGTKVSDLSIGDAVFVLHPHQDIFAIKAEACVKLPETVTPKHAVLAANMETAINAVWDAEMETKTRCAVIGAGVVGLLTAVALNRLKGLQPTIIDINPSKRKPVEALGFQFLLPEDLELGAACEFETIFHTSASASGLQTAIDNTAFEGKVLEMSWYGNSTVSLNLGGSFHVKRLTIQSSQVGTIARSHRKELGYSERLYHALLLLDDPALDILLEEPIEFRCLPDHLEAVFNSDRLCQLVRYQ